MSREKLNQLGIDLPLFPTTTVGSLPKPAYLVKARAEFGKQKISRASLEKYEKQATEFWMRTQDDLGIDVLVDGQMSRGDAVAYFAEQMDGFEMERAGDTSRKGHSVKPVITAEVRARRPMTVDGWRFAQGLTRRPVKAILTGPYTLMDESVNEHYADRKAACLALAREIRRETEALVKAGAKIIQVDEPAVSRRPAELALGIEAMHVVTDGLPAYFIAHLCRGAYEKIYPDMLRIPVDNFDIETSTDGLEVLGLFGKSSYTKDLSFGVVDVQSPRVEDPQVIEKRLRQALEVLPWASLWVDPDCGLGTRTVDEAVGKLSAMVTAARSLRKSGNPSFF